LPDSKVDYYLLALFQGKVRLLPDLTTLLALLLALRPALYWFSLNHDSSAGNYSIVYLIPKNT